MRGPSSPLSRITLQSVALVDAVIERVSIDPYAIADSCGDYPLVAPHPV